MIPFLKTLISKYAEEEKAQQRELMESSYTQEWRGHKDQAQGTKKQKL